MITWLRRFVARLSGTEALPDGFAGTLDNDEQVLAVGTGAQRALVATHLGLWLSEGDTARRIGWHLISKAAWNDGVLDVVEAEETGSAGSAVLLRDLPSRRFALSDPGRLPSVVHDRVTGSIRSRHHRALPGGGAWFVQRKVPGQDGIVLQVRADPGTDETALRGYAEEVAARLRRAAGSGRP